MTVMKREWTKDEDRKLVRMWVIGDSPISISSEIGRSTDSIRNRATRLGLPNRKDLVPIRKSGQEIAGSSLGCRALVALSDKTDMSADVPSGDWKYCQKPRARVVKGEGGAIVESSYCKDHHERYYQKDTGRRRSNRPMVLGKHLIKK